MTTLLRTAADFDAVPDEALVMTIEVVLPNVPHARNRKVWQKFGREFVLLDPGDRDNGERTHPSGYLANMLTGFGSRRKVPGVGLVLGEFPVIDPDSLEQLAIGAIVLGSTSEYPYIYQGDSKWEHLDPSDMYDGEFSVPTRDIVNDNRILHVVYRPGDEELAGFVVGAEPEPAPEAPGIEREPGDIVEPREYDIDKMSPCAQAYVAEYGKLPTTRAEQDRYSAFRFGFERGQRHGSRSAYLDIAHAATERADG